MSTGTGHKWILDWRNYGTSAVVLMIELILWSSRTSFPHIPHLTQHPKPFKTCLDNDPKDSRLSARSPWWNITFSNLHLLLRAVLRFWNNLNRPPRRSSPSFSRPGKNRPAQGRSSADTQTVLHHWGVSVASVPLSWFTVHWTVTSSCFQQVSEYFWPATAICASSRHIV